MNVYLLELLSKGSHFITIVFLAFFGYLNIDSNQLIIENENIRKSTGVNYEIIDYEVEEIVKHNIPRGHYLVKEAGHEGVTVIDGDDVFQLREAQNEIRYVGAGATGQYYGNLTGYGPDCYGCNGLGNLACRVDHNLVADGKYYDDDDYGLVRIVAAPRQKLENGRAFSCGTIVEMTVDEQKITAIVLDRGGALNACFSQGVIVFDLAFASEAEELDAIRAITKRDQSVQFEVKRWGF